jgi:hypothetical protein
VLAAAYAVSGRFLDAVRTSEAAEALAADGTDADLTAQIRARLSIYRRRSVTRDHRLRPAVDDSLPDFR